MNFLDLTMIYRNILLFHMKIEDQLTFNDNPLQAEFNRAFDLLQEGKFAESIKAFNPLFKKDPVFPGLVEGYQTARFWGNRQNELEKLQKGKDVSFFLRDELKNFEKFYYKKYIFRAV